MMEPEMRALVTYGI